MPNIVDYLAWRGDLSFDERPFNDVDSVILSSFSYFDLSGIVPGLGEGSVTMGEAYRRMMDETQGDLMSRVRSLAKFDPELLERMAMSERYGVARLHGYVDLIDEGRSLQFAAVIVDVTEHESYVSFRGTDATLVGWREDFMLSFTTTEAQREAAHYLEQAAAWANLQERRLYVGGHSKGGNLALYAALSCPLSLQPVIACVWSNDGPGLAPDLFPVSPQAMLGERYRRIVPSYDLVGIIFERQDDPRIVVGAKGSGLTQHSPFVWQVGTTAMREEPCLAPESRGAQEALDLWLANVPLESRAVLVDQLFDALQAGGARTLDEVAATPAGARAVLEAMSGMDESTKSLLYKLVGDVLGRATQAAATGAREAASSALQAAWGAVSGRYKLAERGGASDADSDDVASEADALE